MTTIDNTLDSILRKYYHKNTPDKEKEVCFNVFKRKCANNKIDYESYMKNFERKENINTKKTTDTSNKQNYTDFGSEFESWYNEFSSGFWNWDNGHDYENQHKQQTGPTPGSFDYEIKHNDWDTYGEIKDCIYTADKIRVGISALFKVGNRWAVTEFVLYCNGDPEYVIKQLKKYDMFKFVSNGKLYNRYLNINKIWGLDLNLKEHPIF